MKKIKEQYIKFKTAKLAKLKGFDEPCKWFYWLVDRKGEMEKTDPNCYNQESKTTKNSNAAGVASACTQAFLQTWLRNKHGWHGVMIPTVTMGWTFKIMKVWEEDFDPNKDAVEVPPYANVHAYDYTTYEEALENYLVEVLKLL